MPIVLNNEQFTGSDSTTLQAYNASWVKLSSGGNLELRSNSARPAAYYSDMAYVWQGAGYPTGDQRIAATLTTADAGNVDAPALLVRGSNGGSGVNGYAVKVRASANPQLYRINNGTWSEITGHGWTGNLGGTGVGVVCEFKAEGTGATVTLSLKIGAGSWQTYGDTDANRKTSGAAGLAVNYMQNTLDGAQFDGVTIEDLAVVGAVAPCTLTRPG